MAKCADQIVDGITRRADQNQLSRGSERKDEIGRRRNSVRRRWRLQNSKHTSPQRILFRQAESKGDKGLVLPS